MRRTFCSNNHGKSFSGERLIAVYTHTGEFLVKEGDTVKEECLLQNCLKKFHFLVWQG